MAGRCLRTGHGVVVKHWRAGIRRGGRGNIDLRSIERPVIAEYKNKER